VHRIGVLGRQKHLTNYSVMRKKELYEHVLAYFERTMDATETELHFSNPFELLVAVVLSAQCTDKRINQVTPRLFADFPVPEAMAATTPEVIYDYIKSVSYPNNKAKHLVGLAKMLVERFGGEVPSTLEELTQLPGVGRKTANVIQAVAFGKAALAVDTHVFRVSHRLGLVPQRCTTPYSVEVELKKHIPEQLVASSHYWLLLHGRYTCLARKPKCDKCGLRDVCKSCMG
jgi:endonuclease-3